MFITRKRVSQAGQETGRGGGRSEDEMKNDRSRVKKEASRKEK